MTLVPFRGRFGYKNGACALPTCRVYDYGVSSCGVRLPTSGRRDALRVVMSMSTASRSPSLLRVIAWACLGPFAVVGGFAALVFGFAALAVCVRLLLALFGHGGI